MPIILVIVGIAIIFRNFLGSAAKARQVNAMHQGEMPEYAAVFGSQNVRLMNEYFYGASLTAVFGGVDLDLRNAIITKDVVINATAVFGGADIFLPSNVKLKTSSLPIFGGTSKKAVTSEDPDAPTVYVNATCIFGGVDIK